MILRRKLMIQFSVIVFTILILSLVSIYFAFSHFRQEGFYDLLFRKAKSAAKMLDLEEVDPDLLKKLKAASPSTLPSENILFFDRKGKLIFYNKRKDWKIPSRLFKQVPVQEKIKFKIDNYSAMGIFHSGTYGELVIIILAEDSYGKAVLAKLRTILSTVFILSIIVILVAGKIYVDRSLLPINNLIRKINSMEVTTLGERLDTGNRTDEIARLAIAFNQMLDRLQSAFSSQKLFIANASHELRTPLTFISGQLEVLLMKARSVDEYKNAVSSTHEDVLKLIHMANRLLILAHAGSDFSEIKFSNIRVDDMLWAARQELKDIYPGANINVRFSERITDDKQIEINGNEMLLTSAFLNLMENGCKYSKSNSVDVFLDNDANNIIVKFRDNGIGIQKDEISHLFEPFYRGTNAANVKGKGIGLSIVSKVISLHQGSVSIHSEPGKGSEFTVIIPFIGENPVSKVL